MVVTSERCDAATAAQHATSVGAGAIVIAADGREPQELTSCGRGVATMIRHRDGVVLLQQISMQGGSLNASFASTRREGAFAAIDEAGAIREVGWEKYATLAMLSWAAQYLDYTAALRSNLSKPHFRVPLFDQSFGGSVTVQMPPARVLRAFSSLEVEHRLTCADSPRMDESCPAWDHNIALGVVCAENSAESVARSGMASTGRDVSASHEQLTEPGGFVGELARYITPFRRRIGHWLTPASTLMPYLTGANRSCTFRIEGPGVST